MGTEMRTLIKAVVFLPCGMWRKVSSALATLYWVPLPLLCLDLGGLFNGCSRARFPEELQSPFYKNIISKANVRLMFCLNKKKGFIPFILLVQSQTDLLG